MGSKRILYGSPTSPPVRAVRMTLAALELDYEFRVVDVYGGELLKPEFLKKNPLHTVPILEETDGTCLSDSHAIMAYLIRRYGKTDAMYPKDFYKRAVVDQRLHYENGALFFALGKYGLGAIMRGVASKEKIPEIKKNISDAYASLETLIGDKEFIAGDELTIADFSVVSSVSSLDNVVPVASAGYPKLAAWFERMKKLPYFDAVNAEGLKIIVERLKEKLN